MYCPKCGTENVESNKFCQKCGEALAPDVSKTTGSTINLEPNIAGLLCYVLGWITGLIFFILEKENKFIRFHAMQSIVTFGALTVVSIILYVLTLIPWIGLLFLIVSILINVLAFVLWIILMVKAYQGEQYKLPWAGDIAEKNI